MKKKLKIFIPILIVIIIVIFVFVLVIITKEKNKIELNQEKFVYELGDDITSDVSYYLKNTDSISNIKDYKITSDKLKIENGKFIKEKDNIVPLGKYNLTIKNKIDEKKFVIEVVDTIAPEFISSKEVIELEKNTESLNLSDYFEVKDLSNVSLLVDGEYDLSKVGEYKLKIVAKDESNNISSKEFTLKVKEKEEEKTVTTKNNSNNNSSNNSYNKSFQSNSTQQSSPSIGYRKDISNTYVSQINAYRRANGLSELPVTTEAQAEADRRSKELVNYYSHDGAGYGFGEIIGHGDAGGDFIMAWKNSPSHNATMLREQNTAIAASVYEINGQWYAVVSFRMDY